MIVCRTCCYCIPLNPACIIISAVELFIKLAFLVLFGPGIPSSIGIITEFLLIRGVAKRRSAFLWPWIVFNVLLIFVSVVGIVCCIITLSVDPEYELIADVAIFGPGIEYAEPMTTILLLAAVALTYITLVVYSYACELRGNEQNQNEDDNNPMDFYLAANPV